MKNFKHIVTFQNGEKLTFWSEYENVYEALWNLSTEDDSVPRKKLDFVFSAKKKEI